MRPCGVELALDLRALHEPLARGLDLAAARLEDRHRRARPDEHAHRDALGGLGEQLLDRGGVRGPGSKSGSRCHEQTWTWRLALRIASAIRGSAFAPSISTSSELPSRGGAAVCAHRPSVAGASAVSWPWRRIRRMWWWIIARSIPPPTAASKRSSSGPPWVPPYPLASEIMASDQSTSAAPGRRP